ncbi:MAG: hypothetical protein WCI04_04930 [archaeon]
MNYSRLGKLQSDIWWQHDKKQFSQLEKTTQKFLLLLEFNTNQSKKASKLIRACYEEYDKALKTKNFKVMEEKHKQAMISLGFSSQNGENYSNWWIYFSQKDNPKIIKSLFIYHFGFFKGIKKVFAPLFVFLIVLAGILGHNKRNKKVAEMLLSIYWLVILTQGKKKFVLY